MRKLNKLLSWIIAAVIVLNASQLSFAAAKRDVNDPVLREIINELSKKMPRFIDKYGETVFVEDEPITRGSLIAAIYEYDRRTKGTAEPAATGVSPITRQEFDSLRAKVTTLEKSGVSGAKPAAASTAKNNVDMIALIADLEPNMPMLLDNSLSNSKVFKSLQAQVASGGGKSPANLDFASTKDVNEINTKLTSLTKRVDSAELGISAAAAGSKSGKDSAALNKEINELNSKLDILTKRVETAETGLATASAKPAKGAPATSQKEIDELRAELKNIQQSYVKLSQRVDTLDERPVYAAALGKSDATDMNYINKQLTDIKRTVSEVPTASEVRKEIDRSKNQTQADIERIEKRLNSISASSGKSSLSSDDGGGSSGAKIATISLGITMIAALFVAR